MQSTHVLCDIDETPAVWFMNINQEQSWNESIVFPSVDNPQMQPLIEQQEQQLFLIARPQDTVLLRHHPDEAFLQYLEEQGIVLPSRRKLDDWLEETETDVKDELLVPYLLTDGMIETASKRGLRIYGGNDAALVKRLNDKFETRRLAEEHGFRVTRGTFCHSIEELDAAYARLKEEGFQKVVLKIPFGSSGKGLYVIESDTAFKRLAGFIKRRHSSFELLLEGWHPIERSLNAQLLVSSDEVRILAVTEQKISGGGMYLGTDFTPGLPVDLRDRYVAEMKRLGGILQEQGFQGVVGVDSIVDTEWHVYPLIEINARFTQVTYLLPVVARLAEKYSCISSRFCDFESDEKMDFGRLLACLKQQVGARASGGFFVYTFASKNASERTMCRVFVLFYSQDRAELESMMQAVRL